MFIIKDRQNMSHITCIVCGLSCPVSKFNPKDVDFDIYLVTRGGGRGRGWPVVGRESVLGDDFYTPLVKERLLEVVEHFLRSDIIKKKELNRILRRVDKIVFGSFTEQNMIDIENIVKNIRIEKLESNCKILRLQNIDLSVEVEEKNKLYEENTKLRDAVECILVFIVKYFDVSLEFGNMPEYKVILNNLNFVEINYLLTIKKNSSYKEWSYLMEKVRGGNIEIQSFLNSLTKSKRRARTR